MGSVKVVPVDADSDEASRVPRNELSGSNEPKGKRKISIYTVVQTATAPLDSSFKYRKSGRAFAMPRGQMSVIAISLLQLKLLAKNAITFALMLVSVAVIYYGDFALRQQFAGDTVLFLELFECLRTLSTSVLVLTVCHTSLGGGLYLKAALGAPLALCLNLVVYEVYVRARNPFKFVDFLLSTFIGYGGSQFFIFSVAGTMLLRAAGHLDTRDSIKVGLMAGAIIGSLAGYNVLLYSFFDPKTSASTDILIGGFLMPLFTILIAKYLVADFLGYVHVRYAVKGLAEEGVSSSRSIRIRGFWITSLKIVAGYPVALKLFTVPDNWTFAINLTAASIIEVAGSLGWYVLTIPWVKEFRQQVEGKAKTTLKNAARHVSKWTSAMSDGSEEEDSDGNQKGLKDMAKELLYDWFVALIKRDLKKTVAISLYYEERAELMILLSVVAQAGCHLLITQYYREDFDTNNAQLLSWEDFFLRAGTTLLSEIFIVDVCKQWIFGKFLGVRPLNVSLIAFDWPECFVSWSVILIATVDFERLRNFRSLVE